MRVDQPTAGPLKRDPGSGTPGAGTCLSGMSNCARGLQARSPAGFAEAWRARIAGMPGVETLWDEPLSKHTTFRIGGPATCIARPMSIKALHTLLGVAREHHLPVLVLGGGSNILASDEPLNGLVIQLGTCFGEVRFERGPEGEVLVHAGAGALTSRVVSACTLEGVSGLELLAGIPGTIGGALVMNAGTNEGSISDVLVHLDTIDAAGIVYRFTADRLQCGYRSMGLPQGHIVLGCLLRLDAGEPGAIRSRIDDALTRRKKTQPVSLPSAGCIFRNPPGESAGALIDRCGLKGYRVGGAEVSEVHANWVVNRGGATAGDVLSVIEEIERRVLEQFGIVLEREIQVLKP